MGMALNGVPGHVTGINLTDRIGMPNMWFRGPYYDMEAEDTLTHYVHEALGPAASIVFTMGRGIQQISEGKWWRGAESMAPKFLNDISQAVRYGVNGVQTSNGDPIIENVSPYQALVQALGFTPAEISERYEDNSRMRDIERQIQNERRDIQRSLGDLLMDGKQLTPKALARVRAWNKEHPTYPITADTIRRSVQARQRYSAGVRGGVNLDDRLRPQIEKEMAPSLYD